MILSRGSLPSRERGLKLYSCDLPALMAVSLPSRERGLKFHAGREDILHGVAPFTGAWIEIGRQTDHQAGALSLPSRERGLK